MAVKFIAISTDDARQLQSGHFDANSQIPEISKSDGTGNPCRHCLAEVPQGESMLILAHRPFSALQPYAEVGPIFLCAKNCLRYSEISGIPEMYKQKVMLIRGYSEDERIVYGSGKVIQMNNFIAEVDHLFENESVSFIHTRSSTNNCYHFRVQKT